MKKRTVIYLYLITLFSAVVFAETLPNPFTPHVFIEQVQQPMPVSSDDLIGSTAEHQKPLKGGQKPALLFLFLGCYQSNHQS